MPIRKLSALLVNQIAAGEVIERPASVVKELVENSLDAGACQIDVVVEEGGRELIRVADDGSGIPEAEVLLAIEPHATSKITTADDLGAITTMGFRGEALASIASVSRLRMTTRTRSAAAGSVIEVSGDTRTAVQPAGCAPGTVVEVRNLFFNTPARRKFMRAAPTEFSHITEAVERIAMARPGVGFRLFHGDRRTIDLPPGQTPAQRCIAVIGKELTEGMLELESDERGITIWGMAGMPAIARATSKYQYVYINGRSVRDRNIGHAIKEAYRGLIEPSAQPVVALFISMDPTMVDVNVHPSKSEVRFVDANSVHGQVLASIRQRLLQADLTPSASFGYGKPQTIQPSALPLQGQGFESLGFASAGIADVTVAPSADAFVEYFRRMDPYQKTVAYEQMKREVGPSVDEEPRMVEPIRATTAAIMQVKNSYIVTQDEQGIVIIDQHALHERVMFETLIERIRAAGHLESQRLITPVTLTASPGRIDLVARLRPLLDKIGVEADPAGPATVAIHAFPTLLFDRGVDPAEFMETLLDRAEEERFTPTDEAALHETLDMMSCKAAVKAGDRLQPEELTELLRQRTEIERSSNCPHGRPTTIRLSIADLEKHFKRT